MVKVLLVASEAVPFIKLGPLADFAGSLPRYFEKEEYDVRVILPKYTIMDDHLKKILRFVSHFYIELGWRKQYVGILEAVYGNVTYYFIDNEFYFSETETYNRIEDIERFSYFSKAVLESLPIIGFQPDIIHCNNWKTALIPVFLKDFYSASSFYYHMRTILTIHDIREVGISTKRLLEDITGLNEEAFSSMYLPEEDLVSCLLGGIANSDILTTVSETYANELIQNNMVKIYAEAIHKNHEAFYGILNGIDYERYNPQTDPHIAKRYSVMDVHHGKRVNKASIQKNLDLMVIDDIMLIGVISRFFADKGIQYILDIMDDLLLSNKVQFIVIGTGEESYIEAFQDFTKKYPQKMFFLNDYVEEFAHKIYAACDMFLMPSIYEPCGFAQLVSMRYGAIPLTSDVGGLKDSIVDFNMLPADATGFLFSSTDFVDFKNKIDIALEVFYKNRIIWNGMVERGMQANFSWERTSDLYEKLYTKLLL